MKVANDTAVAVNQGGKRNGSIAIYIQPHHPDIMDFLELRKNHGDENARARDLFTALWISNLFMKRVKSNDLWSLFNPDDCKDLTDLYGDEYEAKYSQFSDLQFRPEENLYSTIGLRRDDHTTAGAYNTCLLYTSDAADE